MELLRAILLLCTTFLVQSQNTTNIVESRYKCSDICSSNSTSHTPLVYKARSKIECALACSKTSWCSGYRFNSSSSLYSGQTPTHLCLLFIDDGSTCLGSMASGLSTGQDTSTCRKVMSGGKTRSEVCALTTQRAFEMNDTAFSALIDYGYLQHLAEAGNEIKAEFTINANNLITSSHLQTIERKINGTICITVADFSSALNSTHVPLLVRTFCTNGTKDVSVYNSVSGPASLGSTHNSWLVKRRSKHSLGNGERIFSTLGDSSLLVTAIESGFGFKLLMFSGSRVSQADVITVNQITNEVFAQTSYYENGRMNILSLTTSTLHDIVTWYLPSNKVVGPTPTIFDVTWVSDSCWTHVYTSNSTASASDLNNLISAIDNGQRIRVGFEYKDITIYATAAYAAVSPSHVTAHVMNIAWTKNSLFVPLPILNQVLLLWTHAVLSSTGHATLLNVDVKSSSSKPSQTAITSNTKWYVEVNRFRVIHTSTPAAPINSTTLAELVDAVDQGTDVRVRMHSASSNIVSLFQCDLVQNINAGQGVRCQANGLLAVDFIATLTTSNTTQPPSNTGILGNIKNIIKGTIKAVFFDDNPSTGCPQHLLFSTSASVSSYICCIQNTTLEEPLSTHSVTLDWLVPV